MHTFLFICPSNIHQQSTCSSISWSCKGLVCESISIATSPILLDSSCIRTELSKERQQAKHTHVFNKIRQKSSVIERKKTAGTYSGQLYPLGESNVPGKYLLNLRLYCPGSHSAARELHAAPGPLFCGSLKYFLIFALQMTKYSNNHSQGFRAVPYYNSCSKKYTASPNVSVRLRLNTFVAKVQPFAHCK